LIGANESARAQLRVEGWVNVNVLQGQGRPLFHPCRKIVISYAPLLEAAHLKVPRQNGTRGRAKVMVMMNIIGRIDGKVDTTTTLYLIPLIDDPKSE
jgi:hypothetical protein